MLVDLIAGVEFFQFLKRLVGCHDDLDILEFFKVCEDGFRLVFAVFAIGAEEHDDCPPVLFDVILGQVGGARSEEHTSELQSP